MESTEYMALTLDQLNRIEWEPREINSDHSAAVTGYVFSIKTEGCDRENHFRCAGTFRRDPASALYYFEGGDWTDAVLQEFEEIITQHNLDQPIFAWQGAKQ